MNNLHTKSNTVAAPHRLDCHPSISPSTSVAEIITAYHLDQSWLHTVMDYLEMDEATFVLFIACYRPKLAESPSFPFDLPTWCHDTSTEEYTRQREEVCQTHGWFGNMAAHNILHLEAILHDGSKPTLHEQWMAALKAKIKEGQEYHILDYGCGASSFGELALMLPGTRCTLAEVAPGMLDYLQWKFQSFLPERVCLHQLSLQGTTTPDRYRVRVNHQSLQDRYDAIVLADVLEHTMNPLATLGHMLTHLKTGGIILVSYPREIEGDWHTPEAYYLRDWCYRLLYRSCTKISPHIFQKQSGIKSSTIRSAIRLFSPILQKRANQFAINYFQHHGETLLYEVKRSGRIISIEELVASVGK